MTIPSMPSAAVIDISTRLNTALTDRRIVPAPTPGLYPGAPEHEYHAWEGASNSRLQRLARTPAHLRAYLDEPPHETPALVLGRAIHKAILEPDLFTSLFMTAEQCGAIKKGDKLRCTNAGIAYHLTEGWLCGVHAKIAGPFDQSRSVLSPDDYATCLGTRDAVHAHPAARAILTRLQEREVSLVWVDAETGVTCKARFDGYAPDVAEGLIVDLKSTEDASPRGFERSILKYGYHCQGAHYLDGAHASALRAMHFANIAIEKTKPYAVGVYRIREDAIDTGARQLRPLLARYKQCFERDEWPAYSPDVEDIALPPWAYRQIDEDIQTLETLTRTAGTDYSGDPS